jgi:hypothetical protein
MQKTNSSFCKFAALNLKINQIVVALLRKKIWKISKHIKFRNMLVNLPQFSEFVQIEDICENINFVRNSNFVNSSKWVNLYKI